MLCVMTGATSGFGKEAATMLIADGHRVVAGRRGSSGLPDGAEARPLDLADLDSVRTFAENLPDGIDSLVLNAGMQHQQIEPTSKQGFELTFAVNHLAHYLFARLALPKLSENGRLIITSSGTHDPREKTGVPPPRHADARLLAYPHEDPDLDSGLITAGMRAYSSSKLCNLLTARKFATLEEVAARSITVHAYDPGFIPETGLGRAAPWIVRKIVLPLLAVVKPLGGMNSLADGAKGLRGLADGSITGDAVYMSLRKGKPTWPEVSDIARDDTVMERLWADSAEMVGLSA